MNGTTSMGISRSSFLIDGDSLMLPEYARQHVARYLGPQARKPVACGVSSVSGAILAACSCTVLPLFKGMERKGAGLGPAMCVALGVVISTLVGLLMEVPVGRRCSGSEARVADPGAAV